MKEREMERDQGVERGEEIELFFTRLVPLNQRNHGVYETMNLVGIYC